MQLSKQWILSFRSNLAYLSHLQRSSSLRLLFNTFADTLPVGRRLLRLQNENAPCRGDRDPVSNMGFVDGTHRLSRNVGKQLPTYAVWLPVRAKASTSLRRKSQISQHDASCSCEVPLTNPYVAVGDGPQIWRVTTYVLNKHSRVTDNGWSSSLGAGRRANISSP
jgi:hypothetical protein